MNVLDWILTVLGIGSYVVGRYHGKNAALVQKTIPVVENALNSIQQTDAEAARAGTAAGAAANAASHSAGPKK